MTCGSRVGSVVVFVAIAGLGGVPDGTDVARHELTEPFVRQRDGRLIAPVDFAERVPSSELTTDRVGERQNGDAPCPPDTTTRFLFTHAPDLSTPTPGRGGVPACVPSIDVCTWAGTQRLITTKCDPT